MSDKKYLVAVESIKIYNDDVLIFSKTYLPGLKEDEFGKYVISAKGEKIYYEYYHNPAE